MYQHPDPFLTTPNGVLFKTDCMELLPLLRSETVNTVFADPPFNLGKDYKNGFNDRIVHEEYFAWCRKWIQECARIVKPGGSFFLYATPELAIQFGSYLGEYLNFRHWIALSMKGTFPRGRKLYPAHYALLYYTKGEPATYNRLRLPVPTCRHDFWEDTSPNRHKRFKVRPGVNELKPVIPERAILMSTEPGDLVLDPFGGGGTTFQAAEIHGRNWVGCELYDCGHIRTRLEEISPSLWREETDFDWRKLFVEDYGNEVLRRRTREDQPLRYGAALPRIAASPP